VEWLSVYNYTYDVNDISWISPGTILVIKEPYLRFGSADLSASLRVDSPSNLILVDPTDLDFLEKIEAKKW
jgi:hypothetical protein